jgi:hypothetical protein
MALAMELRRKTHAPLCIIICDGATSKGDFYEARNIAGVWHLPIHAGTNWQLLLTAPSNPRHIRPPKKCIRPVAPISSMCHLAACLRLR